MTRIKTFYLIDFIRCCAALCVVVFHYKNFFKNDFTARLNGSSWTDLILFRHLDWIIAKGSLAVMLFWVISGFVFAHVYLSDRSRKVDPKSYAVNRFSRLYPLHLLTLLYIAVLQSVATRYFGEPFIYGNNDAYHFALNLAFASNWGFESGLSFNGPIWSVSIEVVIYVVFIVLLVLGGPGWQISLVACFAFLGLMAVSNHLILVCGAHFYFGCLAYAVFRYTLRLTRCRQLAMALLCVAAGIAPMMMAWKLGLNVPLTLQLAPLFSGLLILVGLFEATQGDRFRFLKPVGDITYSTYLLHSPLQMSILMVGSFGVFAPDLLVTNIFAFGYFALLIAISRWAYIKIECPAQNAIRRYQSRLTRARGSETL